MKNAVILGSQGCLGGYARSMTLPVAWNQRRLHEGTAQLDLEKGKEQRGRRTSCSGGLLNVTWEGLKQRQSSD